LTPDTHLTEEIALVEMGDDEFATGLVFHQYRDRTAYDVLEGESQRS
jgi:hypothetical protein